MRRRQFAALLLAAPAARAQEGHGWPALTAGHIVLFRHAHAPGYGDPPRFTLGDCRTQRNLDETGRAQARRLGATFRARGIAVGQVLCSQWCRCRETAELAFPGLPREDAAFNSFFEDADRGPAQTRAARERLLPWRGPGVLVVVTHQVNITALTGVVPASGEGVVLHARNGELEVVARLPA